MRDNAQRVAKEWWRRWIRLWGLVAISESTRHNLMVLVAGPDTAKESAAREIATTVLAFGTQSVFDEPSIDHLSKTWSPWVGV